MKTTETEWIDLTVDELEAFLQRAKATISEEDYKTLKALVDSYVYLTGLLDDKQTTIERLRKLIFGSSSEKTSEVIKTKEGDDEAAESQADTTQDSNAEDSVAATQDADQETEPAAQSKGHGRNGADAYTGAEKIRVPHESLQSGDACPDCKKGKVYKVKKPGRIVRITGQAPVQATVYELQKLRCNLCGKVFTARPPEGVGSQKYDAASASMIALLKYGSGLPFNRLEGLQGSLGIPLPASTQWDIVSDTAEKIEPIYDELIRQAAQGEVIYNDDTTMKILELMGKRAKRQAAAEQEQVDANDASRDGANDAPRGDVEEEQHDEVVSPQHDVPAKKTKQRTGVFTSGIVSTSEGRTMALFFTGRRHAGENLAEVLRHRAADLSAPIQMCDALSRNEPKEFKTILANCNAHSRRRFVDVVENFPTECRFVLETLREVYKHDAIARQRNLSPEQRLRFHQSESGPLMKKLKEWFNQQFEDRLVEPNSGLGQAIAYMLKHWKKLTLFLRQPGAPLDNNITERALKRAILHRKNAMFYMSENGAHVGDLFMSLIHTCQLGKVDPFEYLTTLQRHAADLASDPAKWMPWNYRDELRT